MVQVKCDHAGKYPHCAGCPHALPHAAIKEISTMTPGRGRTCRSWGACVLVAATGRRTDREAVAKVRCRKVLDVPGGWQG